MEIGAFITEVMLGPDYYTLVLYSWMFQAFVLIILLLLLLYTGGKGISL